MKKSWEWKVRTASDTSTMHCDVLEGEILDFYGESHHSLWKGWFDVGKQTFENFLHAGPLKEALTTEKIAAEIRQHLISIYKPPKSESQKQVFPERYFSDAEKAAKKEYARLSQMAPQLYPPRDPDPLTGNDCGFEIILSVENYPDLQLTDLSVGLGDSWLYERHLSGADSVLRQSKDLLVFQGAALSGKYRFYATAQVNEIKTRDNPSALLERELTLAPGVWQRFHLILSRGKLACETLAFPGNIAQLKTDLVLTDYPARSFHAISVWLNTQLIFDESKDVLTYHSQKLWPEIKIGQTAEVRIADLNLAAGTYQIKIRCLLLTAGEMDAHPLEVVESVALTAGEVRNLKIPVPASRNAASRAQAGKVARARELRGQILEALRDGGEYRSADKEGGWERLYFSEGHFLHESGSYASSAYGGCSQLDENKIIDILLEKEKFYLADRHPLERLEYLLRSVSKSDGAGV